jgi:glycosyltransferase involved in cell wall biosynthesis
MNGPILSICISTRNRAKFIEQTLDSIVSQLEPEVELIVLDGASTDNTPELMNRYVLHHPGVRYLREEQNGGVDQDYDKVVGYACGSYCWLMTDDDLMLPGAIRRIVAAASGAELIVANSEMWSGDFSTKLETRRLHITEDRWYSSNDRERFFVDCAPHMTYIGAVIVKREIWMRRDRRRYYGTEFIHLGAIFQLPSIGPVYVIAEPLTALRNGNFSWGPRRFEVWAVKFPRLIWALPEFSESARMAVTVQRPWKNFRELFYWRATNTYSKQIFSKFISSECSGGLRVGAYCISIFPGFAANFLAVLYMGLFRRTKTLRIYDLINSNYSGYANRILVRFLRLSKFVNS